MKNKQTVEVLEPCPRLDLYLCQVLPDISRNKIARLIRDGAVQINGSVCRKKNHHLEGGETIEIDTLALNHLQRPQDLADPYQPGISLTRLFEDQHILVIDKPAGIAVHPGAGARRETILDIFLYHFPAARTAGDRERPGIVHRLDRDTSGVLILAKTARAIGELQLQFKARTVKKSYLALLRGQPRFKSGRIDAPIARHPRRRTRFTTPGSAPGTPVRQAETDYRVLIGDGTFSLVRLLPSTGRTHQLRVHLAHLQTPILGDPVYGSSREFQRLALHAEEIQFRHPVSSAPIRVRSGFPDSFREFLRQRLTEKARRRD